MLNKSQATKQRNHACAIRDVVSIGTLMAMDMFDFMEIYCSPSIFATTCELFIIYGVYQFKSSY